MRIRLDEKTLPNLTTPGGAAQAYFWDDQLTGFGVVVSARSRTFIVRGRVAGGARRKVVIGVAGRPRDDGYPWTVKLARQRAKEVIGELAAGIDPHPDPEAPKPRGPTLAAGLKLHVANMKKGRRSPRSIATIEKEVAGNLSEWLSRPMADLRGADLVELHDDLTASGKSFLANRLVAHVSAIWNSLDRVHELPGRNPAKAVMRNPYTPKRERVADADLPGWHAKVLELSPIRRDLQLFMLFTGMRSEAARRVRWEHVDEDAGALLVPKPKGGEAKAFTLPLCQTALGVLLARREGNPTEMMAYGGDAGWAFPGITRTKPFRVQPLAQPHERRPVNGKLVKHLPGPHVLRRTYLSIAAEAGVGELDRHVLANHAFGRQSVNATYIEQAFSHLAECQAKIEAAIWRRIKADPAADSSRATGRRPPART